VNDRMDHSCLALVNGNVITVDAANPRVEAVAVAEGKILAVGTNEKIRSLMGENAETVDLNGKIALPGFIDCHTHFLQMGISLSDLDLRGTSSIDEAENSLSVRKDLVNP